MPTEVWRNQANLQLPLGMRSKFDRANVQKGVDQIVRQIAVLQRTAYPRVLVRTPQV